VASLTLLVVDTAVVIAQTQRVYGDACRAAAPPPWGTPWYVRAEYLALWAKGNRVPALLTTSPTGTPRTDAGVLGVPGTDILVGDERVDDGPRAGGRLTFGRWFDAAQTFALEARWWTVAEARNDGFSANSLGDPILARPLFNTETGAEDAQLIAFPNVVTGSIRMHTGSEMHSAELLARGNWLRGTRGFIDGLVGYRYFRFWEGLMVREDLVSTDAAGPLAVGTQIDVSDRFRTENDLHAVELGVLLGLERNGWLFDITTKVALGDLRQQLTVGGLTRVAEPGVAAVTTPGGLLALPSNSGHSADHQFVAMPELDVRLAYVAYEVIELSVGYNLIIVGNVLRTGAQIDRAISPSQLASLPLARGGGAAGQPRPPVPVFHDMTMWMHGITFGAQLRW
jgi:hypothetical protein